MRIDPTEEQKVAIDKSITALLPEGDTLTRVVVCMESMDMENGDLGVTIFHSDGMQVYDVQGILSYCSETLGEDDEEDE